MIENHMKNRKSFENKENGILIKRFIKELMLKTGPAFSGNLRKSKSFYVLHVLIQLGEGEDRLLNQTKPDLHGEIRKSPCKPDTRKIYMGIYEFPHLNLQVTPSKSFVYMGRFVTSPCKSDNMDIYVHFVYIYMHIQVCMYA